MTRDQLEAKLHEQWYLSAADRRLVELVLQELARLDLVDLIGLLEAHGHKGTTIHAKS